MNWVNIGKATVSFVVSSGVGAVMKNAIKATTPKDISKANKLLTGIGGFVLASMVADKASEYAVKQLDTIFNFMEKQEAKKELKDETTA